MTIDDLVGDVIQSVPEAPMLSIRDALRWAQRELCKDGNAWVVSDGPVVVAANTPYAEIEAPPGARPVRVLSLSRGDHPLEPGADYTQASPSSVELKIKPKQSTLSGRLAVRPDKDMPEALLAEHSETLCHGAKYRLLTLPQPWRDPDMAEFHHRHWRAGINDAYRLSMYGHHVGGAKAKLRRFI